MSDLKKKYVREFIKMEEDNLGYGINNKKVTGSCKFEIIKNKIRIKIYIQNLKKSMTGMEYKVYLIKADSIQSMGLNVGNLKMDSYGRTEFKYEKIIDASYNEQKIFEDFNVIAIVIQECDKDIKDIKVIKSPLVGYRTQKIAWKQKFSLYENEKRLKKFHLDIEEKINDSEKLDSDKGNSSIEVAQEEQLEEDLKKAEEIKPEVECKTEKNDKNEELVGNSKQEFEKPEIEEINKILEENKDEQVMETEMTEKDKQGREMGKKDSSNEIDEVDGNLNDTEKQLERFDNVSDNIKDINLEQNQEYLKYQQEYIKNKIYNEDYYGENLNKREIDYHNQLIKSKAKEVLDDMFATYPRMKSFENESDCEQWIRIEPRDISVLPIDVWRMTNNPFLINGYYAYNHLILGEIKNDFGETIYMIGVPAKYHPKQRRTARLHGFEQFRCCQNIKPFVGEVGYWLLEIRL